MKNPDLASEQLLSALIIVQQPLDKHGANRYALGMARISPYHTNSPEYPPKHREVYHDKDTCPDGKRIKPEHREPGTGNKKHCLECDKVN
jgi:hypothetical protein